MPMTPDEVVKVLNERLCIVHTTTDVEYSIALSSAVALIREGKELKTKLAEAERKGMDLCEKYGAALIELQDYQKLRERVSVEKIDSLIRNYAFRHECNLGNEGIILEKSICEIAQAIVTYLGGDKE
jgi:hypothetical protein